MITANHSSSYGEKEAIWRWTKASNMQVKLSHTFQPSHQLNVTEWLREQKPCSNSWPPEARELSYLWHCLAATDVWKKKSLVVRWAQSKQLLALCSKRSLKKKILCCDLLLLVYLTPHEDASKLAGTPELEVVVLTTSPGASLTLSVFSIRKSLGLLFLWPIKDLYMLCWAHKRSSIKIKELFF